MLSESCGILRVTRRIGKLFGLSPIVGPSFRAGGLTIFVLLKGCNESSVGRAVSINLEKEEKEEFSKKIRYSSNILG